MNREFVSPTLSEASKLLGCSHLPTDDLSEILLKHFIGVHQSGQLVALGGLEVLNGAGLLRSVAVHPDFRRSGLATVIVRELESRALSLGLDVLYLLTTDAATYFEKHNFAIVDRSSVPDTVKKTAQFSELCPDSATVMIKHL
ncbi:MAG: arsenic resistance N-acetyltransferase ArsN2 [Pseudomonadota bacterium]